MIKYLSPCFLNELNSVDIFLFKRLKTRWNYSNWHRSRHATGTEKTAALPSENTDACTNFSGLPRSCISLLWDILVSPSGPPSHVLTDCEPRPTLGKFSRSSCYFFHLTQQFWVEWCLAHTLQSRYLGVKIVTILWKVNAGGMKRWLWPEWFCLSVTQNINCEEPCSCLKVVKFINSVLAF